MLKIDTKLSSCTADVRLGSLHELELSERLLELLAHARERSVRLGRDHRPDVLERETNRPSLERRQARRGTERLAVELLVDVHTPRR